MNLLQRLLKGPSMDDPRGIDMSTIEDYAKAIQQYGGLNPFGIINGGIQQTLAGQATEPAPNNFAGLASHAYQANGVIFACMMVRMLVFSSVRFQWQTMRDGKPSKTFGTKDLRILERPWVGGTTQDMLVRAIQHADLAGNAYITRQQDELVMLRPDWVDIALEERFIRGGPSEVGGGQLGWRKAGYFYWEGGRGAHADPVFLFPEEVAHYAPIPDPMFSYRGMSWLTPVIREIQADQSMTRFQQTFMDGAATPNMVIRHFPGLPGSGGSPGIAGATLEAVEKWVETFDDKYSGVERAGRTMHLYPGADATVVGSNLKEIEFASVRGHGETRIAAAAGVPPVIVGLSEGLQAATYCGVYDQPVWTPRGVVKLGDIREGDAVWSFVNGHIETRKVLWQAQTGTKPVYAIRTKNRTIRFTDNHPVLVRVPGNSAGSNAERSCRVEWRRVDELKVGDRIVQAQHLPDQGLTSLPNGSPATVEILQWLGAYTGDGCLNTTSGVRMCIPTTDRVAQHYRQLAGRLFTKQTAWATPGRRAKDGLTDEMVSLRAEGLTYREIVDRMGLTLHPMSVRDRVNIATRDYQSSLAPVKLREARNAFEFSSRTAIQWHHDLGVTGSATTKRVPPWVFELSEELRLAYLAGVVDTDGSVGKDGRLQVSFANRMLVEDVRLLLISCGIACSNVAHTQYTAANLPNPGKKDVYDAWRLTASSAVEVARIPFTDQLYRERVDANQHRHRPGGRDSVKAGLDESLGFYAIRSIDIEPAEAVYDIEVDGGHSFLADGVVVHNSNYGQARRRLADGTAHPLWQNLAGSLERVMPPMGDDVRLWYDASNVPFLREDEKDAAEIQKTRAETINTLITAGYKPESVVTAVESGDFGLLEHTGMTSVQLLPPGTSATPANNPSDGGSNQ